MTQPFLDPATASPPELEPEPRPRSVLANRNFLLLWQGQAVSQLGNQAFVVGMAFWLLRATGSASLMGLLMAASALPSILLSPIGGALADRLPRITLVIVSDLVNGLAILAPAAALFYTQRPQVIVPILGAVAVLDGLVRAVFQPAVNAAVPDLVPASQLGAANSLNQVSGQICAIIGQTAGGVLYNLVGARLLFLFDAVTFFFSAGCSGFIDPPPRPPRAAAPAATAAASFRQFGREIAEGFTFVRRHRGLLGFMLTAASYNFFLMPVGVLLPFYVQDYLHAGAAWYGFILAAVSGGALLGVALAGSLHLTARQRGRFVIVLFLLAPTPYLAIAIATSKPIALVLAALLGAFVGMVNVYSMTVVQAATPAEMRGRVIGLLATLAGALAPAGMAAGGFLGDLTGKNVTLIYTGCGLAALLVTAILILRRPVRDFLAAEPPPGGGGLSTGPSAGARTTP
jgi:DHA3 family macrolide efflux protein-like MFS transporter